MRGSFKYLPGLFAAVMLFFCAQARSATMSWDWDSGFYPSSVSIAPGQMVTFQNLDLYGFDVRITIGGSLSFVLGSFEGMNVLFPYAGNYTVVSDWGDFAQVNVVDAPTVAITNLVNGATFYEPATVEVQVDAFHANGIAYVDFWLDSGFGDEYLGYDDQPPYSITVSNLPSGVYFITAKATDGVSFGEDWVFFFVDPIPVITLESPRLESGLFQFDVSGLTPGKMNVLQYSTNCIHWSSISTNFSDNSSVTFSQPPTVEHRFYRVLELP